MKRALVLGIGVAGKAVARALTKRGVTCVLVDDNTSPTHEAFAKEIGAELFVAPDIYSLGEIVKGVDIILPAPGVPESHPLFSIAHDAQKELISEIELAYRWEQTRPGGPRPIVAVTGTDGKTTTTLLAAAMISASGRKSVAVGNTDTPFIAALDSDADVFVVECSSFRLALTSEFRAEASVWLNIAPDHLDWHVDIDSYVNAKAKLWASLRESDAAVAPTGSSLITGLAAASHGRLVPFGEGATGGYRLDNGHLVGPSGSIAPVSSMKRALPHDISNALAAAAICLEAGVATNESILKALETFLPARHRIEFVGERDGVRWFDDSKATSPHAVRTALRAFPRVVLIAGGRNKGLNLAELIDESATVRAVVGIGECGSEIASIFSAHCPTAVATSMKDAVLAANGFAEPGDVVLLSPACTSFDWYKNYEERGVDYANNVRALLGADKSKSTKGLPE